MRLALLLCLLLPLSRPAAAQDEVTRFGLGVNTLLSTADGPGLGFGLRGRASAPINADLSVGVDLGLTAFVLGGRDDASYVFDPQVSAIVSLPSLESGSLGRFGYPYILAGVGAYLSFDDTDDGESGPTLHGGIGWVRPLSESTLFYEFDPALIIGARGIDLALPFRLGMIF